MTQPMSSVPAKWIGLAEVESKSGKDSIGLRDAGAFVVVVGLAGDSSDFVALVSKAADRLGLKLVQSTDVEPYASRIAQYDVDQWVRELATSLSSTTPVLFGEFCIFPRRDEPDE